MNVCHDCKHHLWGSDDAWHQAHHRNTLWNNLCGAIERPPTVDPTSGQRVYASTNALGQDTLTAQQHPFCRDINPTGECALFEPKVKDAPDT